MNENQANCQVHLGKNTKLDFPKIGQIYGIYPKMEINLKETLKKNAKTVTEEKEQRKTTLDKIKAYVDEEMSEDLKTILAKNGSFNIDPLTNKLEDPQILFLGTSSMKPTAHRGASAIYVMNQDSAILLDAAEGSYGQLFDHFKTQEAVDSILVKTRVIYITHLHGDHCYGINKMLLARDKAL